MLEFDDLSWKLLEINVRFKISTFQIGYMQNFVKRSESWHLFSQNAQTSAGFGTFLFVRGFSKYVPPVSREIPLCQDGMKNVPALYKHEIWNSRVTKSSCETELHKMTSHFELLTQKFLWKFFFRVTNLTS